MAQQRRMIYAKIFGTHSLNSLSIEARYLYVAMIVLSDDDGRLNGDPRYLKGQVFSYDESITSDMVKGWRDALAEHDQIELYKHDNNEYISHPNWKEYQSIRSDMYVPSRIPKPKRSRNEVVTETVHKLSKGKLSKEKESPPKNQVVNFSEEDVKMVDLLSSLIKMRNPEWEMKGSPDKWAEDINKIHRIDGRNYEQIEYMIRWVQKDSFWCQNILSASKLREKFNDLIPKVRGASNKTIDSLSKVIIS
jgi:hypothetical protein